MGRPLSKQQLFGANANNNIKVQFHNGTSSVKGFIVEQTGSKRFKCQDENGVQAVCYLTEKASASLAAGEMSITILTDDNAEYQVSKITRHRVTYNGGTVTKPWSFTANLSDGYVQMEEAGTDTAMTSSVDLEGDDSDNDYPIAGSGTYKTGATALSGITYAAKGTPAAPGGEVTTVANSAAGLWRKKYDGNFAATNAQTIGSWPGLPAFFATARFLKGVPDTKVSWGAQSDGATLGQSQFSIEWVGYVKVPTTQNYNFYAESDDSIAMWIGSAAADGVFSKTNYLVSSVNKSLPANATDAGVVNANSVTLDASKWYPVRIWFSEFTGSCKAQVFAQGADGTKLNGSDLQWCYNTATSGF